MEHSFYQLLWFFLVYSFLGWLMETAAAAARKGRLLKPGFLNAPFSPPIYGLSAVFVRYFPPRAEKALPSSCSWAA